MEKRFQGRRPRFNKIAVAMLISAMKAKLLALSPPPPEEYDPGMQLAYFNAVDRHRYLIQLLEQYYDATNVYEYKVKEPEDPLRLVEQINELKMQIAQLTSERDNALKLSRVYAKMVSTIKSRIYTFGQQLVDDTAITMAEKYPELKKMGKVKWR